MIQNHEPESPPRKGAAARPLLFLLLLGAVIAIRYFHLEQYLDKESLRRLVGSFGVWGPVIYLMVWALAPALLLPGLPITLAGGLLFGPFWGVVYVACGATAGATLAFLVARYLARDWVAAKISGTRAYGLDESVARHGWKVVAFTRLVPIFPYFLVNYAFGLTRIRLFPYAVATFFAMLPLTIAYVYFSSNILDLFQGKISVELILGAVLVVLATLIPVVYKRLKPGAEKSLEI